MKKFGGGGDVCGGRSGLWGWRFGGGAVRVLVGEEDGYVWHV